MFRSALEARDPTVGVTVDGAPLRARAGDTVAAALLAAGFLRFRRTPVSGTARGPYCMMGVCFDCLVTVNGVPNRQACLVEIADGMRIATASPPGATPVPDGAR